MREKESQEDAELIQSSEYFKISLFSRMPFQQEASPLKHILLAPQRFITLLLWGIIISDYVVEDYKEAHCGSTVRILSSSSLFSLFSFSISQNSQEKLISRHGMGGK